MSNIIVLGSEGYIGSVVCRDLKAAGYKLLTIDTGLFGQRGYINRRVVTELTKEDVAAADAIIHLAGHSSVALCSQFPKNSWENNVTAFQKLLEMLTPKTKLIYASSASVYGFGGTGEVFSETSAFKDGLCSLYDNQKREQDRLAREAINNGLSIVGLRFGTVCGPSPNQRLDTLYNSMVFDAMTTGRVKCSKATYNRAILTIKDLSEGIQRVLAPRTFRKGIFNLASFNTDTRGAAIQVSSRLEVPIEYTKDTSLYSFHLDTRMFESAFGLVRIPSCTASAKLIRDLKLHYENSGILKEDKKRFCRSIGNEAT